MTGPDSGPARSQVRAAGGVVWRRTGAGLEVLLVHRPRYDDWSLPKGKCEPGEDDEVCALREVEEETGLACRLGAELPTIRYRDHQDRDKAVRYWSMTVTDGRFTPNHEVDEVRWVPWGEASAVLSYAHDAVVVRALEP